MSLSFELGGMTIHRVIEMEAPLFDPLEFFPDLTRETLDANLSWLGYHQMTAHAAMAWRRHLLHGQS